MTPEQIEKLADEYVDKRMENATAVEGTHTRRLYKLFFLAGSSCREGEIAERDERLKRMEKLIEEMYKYAYLGRHEVYNQSFDRFKKEHNL